MAGQRVRRGDRVVVSTEGEPDRTGTAVDRLAGGHGYGWLVTMDDRADEGPGAVETIRGAGRVRRAPTIGRMHCNRHGVDFSDYCPRCE